MKRTDVLRRVGGENEDESDRRTKPTRMTEMFQDWTVTTVAGFGKFIKASEFYT